MATSASRLSDSLYKAVLFMFYFLYCTTSVQFKIVSMHSQNVSLDSMFDDC